MIYEARKNCEYFLQVEADTIEEAIKLAEQADEVEWSECWSGVEVEGV